VITTEETIGGFICVDENGDGFYDEPYKIPPGKNVDNLPWSSRPLKGIYFLRPEKYGIQFQGYVWDADKIPPLFLKPLNLTICIGCIYMLAGFNPPIEELKTGIECVEFYVLNETEKWELVEKDVYGDEYDYLWDGKKGFFKPVKIKMKTYDKYGYTAEATMEVDLVNIVYAKSE